MSSSQLHEIFPWPHNRRHVIIPVFLPFLGCSKRCIFCSQDNQTGIHGGISLERLNASLSSCLDYLKIRVISGQPPCELAFYGGTFTMLPPALWERCLNFAIEAREKGLIKGFRCSTRPDALESTRLKALSLAGCRMIELGIQSFSPGALDLSRRGYSPHTAQSACKIVINAGFKLGVQLMPGMPGSSAKSFRDDVRMALQLGASCLRFYPCLVIDGTGLADLWRSGDFVPWSMNLALSACARGWLEAELRNCQVIRMGLAAQQSLLDALLAGPYHPAFGSRVMGLALYLFVRSTGGKINKLRIPRVAQGYFWGWRGELRKYWLSLLPLENISWHDKDEIWLERN